MSAAVECFGPFRMMSHGQTPAFAQMECEIRDIAYSGVTTRRDTEAIVFAGMKAQLLSALDWLEKESVRKGFSGDL